MWLFGYGGNADEDEVDSKCQPNRGQEEVEEKKNDVEQQISRRTSQFASTERTKSKRKQEVHWNEGKIDQALDDCWEKLRSGWGDEIADIDAHRTEDHLAECMGRFVKEFSTQRDEESSISPKNRNATWAHLSLFLNRQGFHEEQKKSSAARLAKQFTEKDEQLQTRMLIAQNQYGYRRPEGTEVDHSFDLFKDPQYA